MVTPAAGAAGLEPGSIPYGEREPLEAMMGQLGGQQSAAPQQSSVTGDPLEASLGAGDPMGALLSGEAPGSDLSVTDGLSVGPGATPGPGTGVPLTKEDRLRALAMHAKTPMIRFAARSALRREIILRNSGV